MKKALYIVVTALLLVGFSTAEARDERYKGSLLVRQKQLLVSNDSLHISLDVFFSGKVIPSALGLKLVPVLKFKQQSRDLPYMLINGRQRAAYYRREQVLKPCENCDGPTDDLYASVTQKGKKDPQYISYKISIPYEAWMRNASLLLRQIHADCCSETLLAYEVVTKNIGLSRPPRQKRAVATEAFAGYVTYITPEVEKVKMRSDFASAHITYPQGIHAVRADFATNRFELNKINKILVPVLSNPMYTLDRITITGYASPEGSYSRNERLARARSHAFREYLTGTYNLRSGNLFSVSSVAEDWAGLADLVNIYPVPQKNRVLDLISRVRVPDEREERIKKLTNGVPYKYVYANLYPRLRRIEVGVYYVVRPLNDSESERMLQTSPQALSLSEMFRVAGHYQPGSEEYRQLFETAARYYPNEPVANINAAAAALAVNDHQKARFYLAKVSKDKRAFNNMGVYYLQTGNKRKAGEYFRKSGSVDAEKNLRVLKTIK